VKDRIARFAVLVVVIVCAGCDSDRLKAHEARMDELSKEAVSTRADTDAKLDLAIARLDRAIARIDAMDGDAFIIDLTSRGFVVVPSLGLAFTAEKVAIESGIGRVSFRVLNGNSYEVSGLRMKITATGPKGPLEANTTLSGVLPGHARGFSVQVIGLTTDVKFLTLTVESSGMKFYKQ
jgi:hypothetical protein